jgi:3-hydroxyisobutyrate dehydrogenase-like beta-hydroxyacid dehydrogenase
MGSVFTKYKSPAFANLDFAPTFTMPLLQKDFDLGLDAAKNLGVSMPIAQATRDIVADEVNLGNTEQDFATLLLRVATEAGVVLSSENSSISNGLEPQG